MSDTVIKVEQLSKLYKLGEIGTGTLSQDLNRWWARVRGKEDPFAKIGEVNDRTQTGNSDFVWSLRDINFEVRQGEVLGIIGRNGAGKSTLLKILSKVTAPTEGSIKIKGRIASLLEVGTGFHPELTGRENVFLNGAILGMTKAEIRKKFDAIVDFAGIERYIDTPVKRYSSGMYVRLAFAVAAFLEPEILIVDEVLAVGDAEFQKKCLGKMSEVSKSEGRTILFVSHSMGVISQLCQKAVFLNKGSVVQYDYTQKVVDYYLQSAIKKQDEYNVDATDKEIGILQAYTQNEEGERMTSFTHLQKIQIVARIAFNQWVGGSEFRIVLRDLHGKAIFTSDLLLQDVYDGSGSVSVMAEIPANFLRPGSFTLTFATFVPHQFIIDLLEDILSITVIDGGSKYASSEGLDYGYIFFDPKWSLLHSSKGIVSLG